MKLFKVLERVGLFIGNIISTIFLTVFYFTIFAIFAMLNKLIKMGRSKNENKESAFIIENKVFSSRDDFAKEF